MATEDLDPDPRDIQYVNITSSHKIGAKTTRCLTTLFPSSATATSTTIANAVCIRATAPVAGKAITIAEIVKRRMEERQEKWFQYTALSTEEIVKKQKKPLVGTGEEADEEDPFVPLSEKKSRAKGKVTIISIYISRSPLPSYKELYGEQAGGGESTG